MTDFDDVPLFTGCAAPLSVDPPRAGHALSAAQAFASAEQRCALLNAAALARDEHLARQRLLQLCSHPAFAAAALPLDGRTPDLPLVRSAARCWGNIEFGIREGTGGDGEAFAWDLETNVRAVRRFSGRIGDECRKNRPLTEALLDILPVTFIAEALDACRRTCEAGPSVDGSPERCGLTPVSDCLLPPEADRQNAECGLERSDEAAATLSASGHDAPADEVFTEAPRPESARGRRAEESSRRGRRVARRMDDTTPDPAESCGTEHGAKAAEDRPRASALPEENRKRSRRARGIEANKEQPAPEKRTAGRRRKAACAGEEADGFATLEGGPEQKAFPAAEAAIDAGTKENAGMNADPQHTESQTEEKNATFADQRGSLVEPEPDAERAGGSAGSGGAEGTGEAEGTESGEAEAVRAGDSENAVPPAKVGTPLLRYRPELIHCPERSRDVDTLECHACARHDHCPAYA